MSEIKKQYLLSFDNLFWQPLEISHWLQTDIENCVAVLTELLQKRWNSVFEMVVRLFMEIQLSISKLQFIATASNKHEFSHIQSFEERNLKQSIQKYRTLSPQFINLLLIR